MNVIHIAQYLLMTVVKRSQNAMIDPFRKINSIECEVAYILTSGGRTFSSGGGGYG